MEPWRECWRDFIAPKLTTKGLSALADALARNADALRQGITINKDEYDEWGGCAVGYAAFYGVTSPTDKPDAQLAAEMCVWISRNIFVRKCATSGDSLADDFIRWFDNMDRLVVFRELLPEVNRELARRTEQPTEDVVERRTDSGSRADNYKHTPAACPAP